MNSVEKYKAFLDGSEAGLEGLVAEYSDGIIYFAYHTVKNFNVAEDVMEAAFLELVMKKPSLVTDVSLAVYLYKAAGREAKAQAKKKAISHKGVGFLGDTLSLPETEWVEKYLIKSPEDKIKYDSFKDLDASVKPILFLSSFMAFDINQIAEIAGIDAASAGKAISAGRGETQAALKSNSAGAGKGGNAL